MARPRSTAGGRPVVVAARLSVEEAADLDRRRGSLSRAEWLRWLLLRAKKEGVSLESTPTRPPDWGQ